MRGLNVVSEIPAAPVPHLTSRDLRAGETFRFVDSTRGTIYIKGPQNFYTQLTGPSAGAVWDGYTQRADAPVMKLRLNTQVVRENS